MNPALVGTAKVLLAWAVWFPVIAGWGFWLQRLLKSPAQRPGRWTDCFWLGLGSLVVWLQLWHLLWPIDWKAAAFAGVVGLLGAARLSWQERRPGWPSGSTLCYLVAVGGIALLLARVAIGPPIHFDSGLYHFNVVHWLNEYPVVPGLGNLEGRLAFNQTYFFYPALLNVYPWFNHGYNVANGLLFLVLLAQLLQAPLQVVLRPEEPGRALFFEAALFPVVLREATALHLTSPTPDPATFVLALAIGCKFVRFLETTEPAATLRARVFIYFLSAVGLTMKLHLLIFGLTISVLVLLWPRGRPASVVIRQSVPRGVVLVVLLMLCWFARGYIQSGYPVYPATVGGLGLDWEVPEAEAKSMAGAITAYAQKPGVVDPKTLSLHDWLGPWTRSNLPDPRVAWPLILGWVGLIGWVALRGKRSFQAALLWPLGPPAAWLIYWFIVAPDIRYAGAAFWLFSLWPVAVTVHALYDKITTAVYWQALAVVLWLIHWFVIGPDIRYAGVAFWLLGLWPVAVIVYAHHHRITTPVYWRAVAVGLVVTVFSAACLGSLRHAGREARRKLGPGGLGPIPVVQMKPWPTRSGLILNVPVALEHSTAPETYLTWNASLPATHGMDPYLELRGPTLRNGFRTHRP